MLPVLLPSLQIEGVTNFHLFYQDYGQILIAAGGLRAKVLANPPSTVLHFLLMVAVALFKCSLGLSNILPSTPGTTSKVYHESTVTG